MADNFYGSLCLSDIPKELITTAANGKKYINIVINKRQAVSQYGHTHYVKAYVKKDQVIPEGVKLFFGELKPSNFQDTPQAVAAPIAPPATPAVGADENLPF